MKKIVIIAASLLLVGCSNFGEAIGLGRKSPDEYEVVRRAPLSMPKEYSLTPPQPGVARPQEINPTNDAKGLVFTGEPAAVAVQEQDLETNTNDNDLLALAGAKDATPNIRKTIDSETTGLIMADKKLLDSLLNSDGEDAAASQVDALKEKERIEANKAQGKAITEGETPVIKRRKKGLLEDVVN